MWGDEVYISTIQHEPPGVSVLIRVLFGAVLISFMVGMVPFIGAEGDDYGIMSGVAQMAHHGMDSRSSAYRYDVQPGSYLVTLFLHEATGFSVMDVFCGLTAFCGLAFVLLSAGFLSRITNISFPVCGLILLLFPEINAGAYYGNTVTIAAAAGMAALLVLSLRTGVRECAVAGALLGVALWLRLDAVLYAPAAVVLLYDGDRRRTLRRVAVVAGVTALVGGVLLLASDASPASVLHAVHNHEAVVDGIDDPVYKFTLNLRGYLLVFSVVAAELVLLGAVHFWKQKTLRMPILAAAGILPLVAAYAGVVTTPKYLYYTIPFWGLIACFSLPVIRRLWTKKTSRWGVGAALLVAGCLNIVNFGTQNTGFQPDRFTGAGLSVWLGPGFMVNTHDGPRLLTGAFYLPEFWNAYKSLQVEDYRQIQRRVETFQSDSSSVRVSKWGDRSAYNYVLASQGYEHSGTAGIFTDEVIETWNREGRTVLVIEDRSLPLSSSFTTRPRGIHHVQLQGR